MDVKLVFALIGTALTIAAYFPYLRGIYLGDTKPHAYTWLIWCLTVGTATAGMLVGGSGLFAAGPFIIGTILVFCVFLLSLKFGTRNITVSDTVVLLLALSAIIIWWQLDSPLLGVLMATGIDAFGYAPTYRKLWHEPWSERVSAWVLFAVSPAFAILALHEYNVLTVLYAAMTVLANLILIGIALIRRQYISKPVT